MLAGDDEPASPEAIRAKSGGSGGPSFGAPVKTLSRERHEDCKGLKTTPVVPTASKDEARVTGVVTRDTYLAYARAGCGNVGATAILMVCGQHCVVISPVCAPVWSRTSTDSGFILDTTLTSGASTAIVPSGRPVPLFG